jgi:hypothetical protein
MSKERFFAEARWPRGPDAQPVLEVDPGAKRITAHAAATGATIVSFDYGAAVAANQPNHGHLDTLAIMEASILEMPFKTRPPEWGTA